MLPAPSTFGSTSMSLPLPLHLVSLMLLHGFVSLTQSVKTTRLPHNVRVEMGGPRLVVDGPGYHKLNLLQCIVSASRDLFFCATVSLASRLSSPLVLFWQQALCLQPSNAHTRLCGLHLIRRVCLLIHPISYSHRVSCFTRYVKSHLLFM